MSEEFEKNCDCGSEKEKKGCDCSKTEKLLCLTVLTNTITSLALAVIALVLVYNMVVQKPYFPNRQIKQPVEKAQVKGEQAKKDKKEVQKENTPVFKGKSMTLEEAMKKDKYVAVLFYADWCPHCRNFAPTFNNLSKDRKLSKTYNFVRINSEDPSARAKMEEYQVQGFPALYIVNPKTKERQFISNGLLFVEDADKTLKEIFYGFADTKK